MVLHNILGFHSACCGIINHIVFKSSEYHSEIDMFKRSNENYDFCNVNNVIQNKERPYLYAV